MSALPDEVREYARAEMLRFRKLRNISEALGLGFAAGGAIAVPLAPLFVGGSLAIGLVGIAASRKADSAGDKANDPPRDDYLAETVVELPIEYDLSPRIHLEQGGIEFFNAAMRTVAYEQAMVVADERALGAVLAGDQAAAAARSAEAREFGNYAVQLNERLNAQAQRLAGLIDDVAAESEPLRDLAVALREAGEASAAYAASYLAHGPAIA